MKTDRQVQQDVLRELNWDPPAGAAPGSYDVVVDLLWGEPVVAAIDTAKVGARIV